MILPRVVDEWAIEAIRSRPGRSRHGVQNRHQGDRSPRIAPNAKLSLQKAAASVEARPNLPDQLIAVRPLAIRQINASPIVAGLAGEMQAVDGAYTTWIRLHRPAAGIPRAGAYHPPSRSARR